MTLRSAANHRAARAGDHAPMHCTRIPTASGLRIALHSLPPPRPLPGEPQAVLYVHGATFPAQLSMFWRIDGVSWADTLAAGGVHVFGFDQLGFGASDRYAGDACHGRAPEVAEQVGAAVDHIRRELGVQRVHLVAHSWGTAAAALYATQRPDTVGRLVLFAPLTPRDGPPAATEHPATHLVTLDAQWARFQSYVPAGEAPVLPRQWFDPWGDAYLRTDPDAAARQPPAVQLPYGPMADAACLQAGGELYNPAAIVAPTLVVRGEWDPWPTEAEAQQLLKRLVNAPPASRYARLARGTHVMHLEAHRFALFGKVQQFLLNETPKGTP